VAQVAGQLVLERAERRLEQRVHLQEGRVVQTKPGTVPQYKRYLDEMSGVSLQDI